MYKKITHTIVEEHFDHPLGGQIKKSLGRAKIMTNEVFSEEKFKTEAHAYFVKYQDHVDSIIDSIVGTDEEFLIAFDNFFKTSWVDDLGNMSKQIYSPEFGERLNESMRLIASTLFMAAQSVKLGKDPAQVFNRVQFIVNDLAQNLTNFNSQWNYQVIVGLFNGLFTDMVNRAKAKFAKNTTLESQLKNKNTESWNAFEQTLINGIVQQHPERFNKSAVAKPRLHDSGDIM